MQFTSSRPALLPAVGEEGVEVEGVETPKGAQAGADSREGR